MSTASTSNGHPNPSPENDSSTQVKSSHNIGVPSIEIDDTTLPEKFQLPQPSEDDGYYGILWHAFYRPDDIRTEAKIIHEGFALVLAQRLSPYYLAKAVALLGPNLQSWVELRTLRRAFYLWISKSKVREGDEIYEAVKKCEEETTSVGGKLLQQYEFRMNEDKADNEMIARLRTELFFDLSVGKELDLLVDACRMVNGSGRPVKSRLERWNWTDERCVKLKLRDTMGAGQNRGRWLIIDIMGDIISSLGSQGVFLHAKTLSSFVTAEQSREDPSLPSRRLSPGQNGSKATKRRKKTSKRQSVGQTATSSNARKAGRKHTSKIRRQRNSKTLSKTDTGGEDGSASGGDTERLPTPELDAIVEKIHSEICRITPGQGAKEAERDNDENGES
jgi:hypothetical protein